MRMVLLAMLLLSCSCALVHRSSLAMSINGMGSKLAACLLAWHPQAPA